eukprot:6361396-Prymnesium_polylepis.1
MEKEGSARRREGGARWGVASKRRTRFLTGRKTRHFQRLKIARDRVVERINEFRMLQKSLKKELVSANASKNRIS